MTKNGFTLFLFLSAVAIATFRDEQEFCEIESEFDKSHFYSNVKHCGEIPLALSHKLLDALPLDEVDGNCIRTVKRCVFSESQPSPLKEPLTLAAVSQDVLRNILDLNESVIQNEEFVRCVSGGKLFPGSVPLAHRYGGHQLMEDTGADFTMTFRQLSEVTLSQLQKGSFAPSLWALSDLSSHQHFRDWVQLYLHRLSRLISDSDAARQHRMKGVNPRYVLRNWMAESAIRKAEKNDFSEVALLQKTLMEPFMEQEEAERAGYASKSPSWAQQLRVSCSS